MHADAYDYIRRQLAGQRLAGLHVAEIGSYNVNGSVRPLFRGCASYVGIDVRDGPGVDVVGPASSVTLSPPVDIVVTTETLEHDPDPEATIQAARRMLVPGGVLLITAASPERTPHSCDGYGAIPDGEHYASIAPDALSAWLAGWTEVAIEHHPERGDIYARAVLPAAGAGGSGPPASPRAPARRRKGGA